MDGYFSCSSIWNHLNKNRFKGYSADQLVFDRDTPLIIVVPVYQWGYFGDQSHYPHKLEKCHFLSLQLMTEKVVAQ